jgi:hypothetical protein
MSQKQEQGDALLVSDQQSGFHGPDTERMKGKPAVIRLEGRDEDWPPENLLIKWRRHGSIGSVCQPWVCSNTYDPVTGRFVLKIGDHLETLDLADFSGANLGEAELNAANISKANLSRASLNRANLHVPIENTAENAQTQACFIGFCGGIG